MQECSVKEPYGLRYRSRIIGYYFMIRYFNLYFQTMQGVDLVTSLLILFILK